MQPRNAFISISIISKIRAEERGGWYYLDVTKVQDLGSHLKIGKGETLLFDCNSREGGKKERKKERERERENRE